ncbi:hypothetical protein [Metamycoplasma alkalescens]|nr:hypothetical protein [Metamycoplasma alkalescens]
MSQKNMVPKIRFKEFTNAWEQEKLVNILNYEQPTKYIVKSSKYVDKGIPVLTAGKTLILGHTTDKENVKIVSKFNPIIIFDDFTTSSHFIDFPFKIKSSAMKLLTNHNNNDNIYFNFLLLKNLKYIPEGHNRHWISKFTDFKVITTKYEEKNIISSLLQNMDSLITLHQRKLEVLKNMKNRLLNKMFANEKNQFPMIRFKEFTNAWEQEKLVNILNYEQPTKYIVKSSKYVDKGIPVLTAGKTLILGHTTDKENVKIVSKFNPIIIFDDFTTSSHFIDFPFKIKSSAMKLLTNHNNNDNIYFNFLLLKNLKYIPEGHNRHWISKFTDFKVITTKYEEKNIISSLLQNMDSLITLHQRKLDMLKNFKNTLLNKMFV